MSIKKSIESLSFFESLTNEQIDLLLSFSYIQNYEKDNILFYETDIQNNLIFLIKGLVKIYKYDKFENEIFLYHIYENSLVSEISSLKTSKLYCFSNASFVEDSTILSINFEKFQEHFLSKNILTTNLIEALLDKTHQLQCIVNRELVFDATAKVAFMLHQDLTMFNKLKRQDVSFMLHIQPETLSRVLKKLSREEIINIENQNISILNMDKLSSIFKGVGV